MPVRVSETVLAKLDAEAEARTMSCGKLADEVIELGLAALRAKERKAARAAAAAAATVDMPQEALMAI